MQKPEGWKLCEIFRISSVAVLAPGLFSGESCWGHWEVDRSGCMVSASSLWFSSFFFSYLCASQLCLSLGEVKPKQIFLCSASKAGVARGLPRSTFPHEGNSSLESFLLVLSVPARRIGWYKQNEAVLPSLFVYLFLDLCSTALLQFPKWTSELSQGCFCGKMEARVSYAKSWWGHPLRI